MIRTGPLVAVCLLLAGCGEDPARAVRIVNRPAAPQGKTTFLPANTPSAQPPDLDFCPPRPESSGGTSTAAIEGPCAFQHRAPVTCESMRDDFIAAFTRPAKNGGTLVVYINVERYHGPGTYDATQVFVAAQGGQSVFRWSTDTARAVVAPDEKYVLLPETRLELEPVHTGCTTLITPDTNHQFQCADNQPQPAAYAAEIISGKLVCGSIRRTNE